MLAFKTGQDLAAKFMSTYYEEDMSKFIFDILMSELFREPTPCLSSAFVLRISMSFTHMESLNFGSTLAEGLNTIFTNISKLNIE